jgi:hypothetical protein
MIDLRTAVRVSIAVLLAFLLLLWLSGCSVLLPLGERGRLGYVALECRYLPPIGGNAELGTRNAEK